MGKNSKIQSEDILKMYQKSWFKNILFGFMTACELHSDMSQMQSVDKFLEFVDYKDHPHKRSLHFEYLNFKKSIKEIKEQSRSLKNKDDYKPDLILESIQSLELLLGLDHPIVKKLNNAYNE